MTTELGTLLGRAAEQLSTDEPMDQVRAAGLRRIVRRRRVQRHTVESVAGVAAAGVVGTATWFGLDHYAPTPPAQSPSPSVSATPSPSVSTAPTPAPAVPGVPPASVAPAGLLARTEQGWMLAVYRPQYLPVDDVVAPEVTGQEVHLVSPAGEHYAVLSLPVEPAVRVLHWDAAAERARVSVQSGDADPVVGWLDLGSGQVTLDAPSFGESGRYLTTLPDGTELWSELVDAQAGDSANPGAGVYAVPPGAEPRLLVVDPRPMDHAYLDPDGEQLATLASGLDGVDITRIVDGSTVHVPFDRPGDECFLVGWVDGTSLMISCYDTTSAGGRVVDSSPSMLRVDLSDSTTTLVRELVAGDPFPGYGARGSSAGDGTVVFLGTDLTADLETGQNHTTGVYSWTDGAFSLVQGGGDGGAGNSFVTSVRDRTVYVQTGAFGEVGDQYVPLPQSVTAHDLSTGGSTVLSPLPEPTDGVRSWLGDSVSWWVAGASGS